MTRKERRKKNYFEISFLPYIKLKEEVRIGNTILWPYGAGKTKYINDDATRSHLDTILSKYTGKYKKDRPSDVTVVSYKQPGNLLPLNQYTYKYLGDSVTILCFSNLIKNNPISSISSDSFRMIHQRFTVGDTGIAIQSGSYISITTGGLKLSDVMFMMPLYICDPFYTNYDNKILLALSKLQNDKTREDFFRRIMLALDWVSYAYTNVDNFSYASRIVMMATSFEILLEKFADRYEFVRKIKDLVANPADTLKKRNKTKQIVSSRGKTRAITYSYKEWWAYEFYVLRNKIVHGDIIRRRDFRNRKNKEYFGLSIRFFSECLKRILAKGGYYDYDWTDELVWAGIYDEI